MIDKVKSYIGKKFLLTSICQLGVFHLTYLGKMTGSELVAATSLLAGAYIAGNVAQKIGVKHNA